MEINKIIRELDIYLALIFNHIKLNISSGILAINIIFLLEIGWGNTSFNACKACLFIKLVLCPYNVSPKIG